jgi:hypothetical protein
MGASMTSKLANKLTKPKASISFSKSQVIKDPEVSKDLSNKTQLNNNLD